MDEERKVKYPKKDGADYRYASFHPGFTITTLYPEGDRLFTGLPFIRPHADGKELLFAVSIEPNNLFLMVGAINKDKVIAAKDLPPELVAKLGLDPKEHYKRRDVAIGYVQTAIDEAVFEALKGQLPKDANLTLSQTVRYNPVGVTGLFFSVTNPIKKLDTIIMLADLFTQHNARGERPGGIDVPIPKERSNLALIGQYEKAIDLKVEEKGRNAVKDVQESALLKGLGRDAFKKHPPGKSWHR